MDKQDDQQIIKKSSIRKKKSDDEYGGPKEDDGYESPDQSSESGLSEISNEGQYFNNKLMY